MHIISLTIPSTLTLLNVLWISLLLPLFIQRKEEIDMAAAQAAQITFYTAKVRPLSGDKLFIVGEQGIDCVLIWFLIQVCPFAQRVRHT